MRLTTTVFLAAAAAVLLAPAPAFAHTFRVLCPSSHFAKDDPIVQPGRPGATHRHEFFGARAADADATVAELEAGATTCRLRRDTAAYWAPSLEVGGVLVRGTMTAYYSRHGKPRAAAPPRGLKVVAGNARAVRRQPMSVTHWQCVGRGRSARFAERPACRRGERLAAWVLFPDCWDGRRIDSADHASHLAYAVRAACPATHPVPIMRVALLVAWAARPAAVARVTLGGGALTAHGMHADFWNTWHQPTLRQLRWDCIELATPCGALADRR